jgi:hypothetical protein
MVGHGWQLIETTGTAMLVGLVVERMLDTGIRVPGIGAAAGVVGLYVGAWFWALTPWSNGPVLGGVPLLPAAAGAFAVCGFLKLVGLAAEGARS